VHCSDFNDSNSGIEIGYETDSLIPNIEDKIDLKPKRARKEILTPRLAATFHKCKISERESVHLLTAFFGSS
jgi:hypothetical protein